jgi:heat shock protein HtpX
MSTFKRIGLFMLVNIATIVTISIVLNVLGVRPYLEANGINYESLAIFCGVWGMGGAFISLALSKVMAKWMMGVSIIDPRSMGDQERWLLETVTQLSQSAGLPKTPEVGIFESASPNAFATGPTKSRSLVAVSTGLLRSMNRSEVEGVLGHEIAHIANGDMITMTLLQGVINAFVMFFARVAAFALTQALRGNDRDSRPNYFLQMIMVFVFEILFSFLGMLVVAAFSRYREFRADAGGARLAGRESMVSALRALVDAQTRNLPDETPQAMKAFQISGRGGILALFSTHPPLEARIAALENSRS